LHQCIGLYSLSGQIHIFRHLWDISESHYTDGRSAVIVFGVESLVDRVTLQSRLGEKCALQRRDANAHGETKAA